jgi:hypothetical protein
VAAAPPAGVVVFVVVARVVRVELVVADKAGCKEAFPTMMMPSSLR